ncbi:MAG: amidohydrolase family protein [Lentisphaeria bacterium]|nr:amidohydrolase family protein [Lentisphaeria bacterium]
MNPTFDAHTHVWEHQWQDFVVGTGGRGNRSQCDLLLALMDRNGVERACVIGGCDETNHRNNDFVAELCRERPDRFVMLSEISLTAANREELLARTLNDWPALGLRYFAAPDERPDAWSGPEHTSFWEKADAAKLIVALNLGPNQAARLTPLVRDYPNIRWLLDHMARPRYDMDDAAYQPVLDLAGFPNVFVKISAWYAFTADVAEYPYADLARFVVALRDAYGARRLLWGSDALPVLDFSSYNQTYSCLRHIPALSEDDLGWILGKTADSLFQPRYAK